jgi:hypothetical protein
VKDTLGINSPPPEVSIPTHWLLDGRYPGTDSPPPEVSMPA